MDACFLVLPNGQSAHCMQDLVALYYPNVHKIRVVLDNLSTRSVGALYDTFAAPEARRLAQPLEFHYTPKHASWLSLVAIEIGVSQSLRRRSVDYPHS